MGQAKNRGTFEERKAKAISLRERTDTVERLNRQHQWSRRPSRKNAEMMAMIAVMNAAAGKRWMQ